MAISNTDLTYYLSGGAANTVPNNSLGGGKSTTKVTGVTLHNLFDKVDNNEATVGDTEYRCVYLANDHASLTLMEAFVYIKANTDSLDTSIEIGIGNSAIGGSEQAIVNESTPPSGVVFSLADGTVNALTIGDIPFGSHQALWIKRIVSSGASAMSNDKGVLEFGGGTEA